MPGNPIPMTYEEIRVLLPLNASPALNLGMECGIEERTVLDRIANIIVCGPWEKDQVKAGQVWLGPDGKRLVMEARQDRVIYLTQPNRTGTSGGVLSNRYFLQSGKGFAGDVIAQPWIEASKSDVVRLVAWEVQILYGLLSATNIIAFVAIPGGTVTDFFLKNRTWLGKAVAAIQVVLDLRGELRKHAPVLDEKIVDGALLGLWRGTKIAVGLFGPNTAKDISGNAWKDPKLAGKGVGVLLGKLSKDGLSARFAALKFILNVLIQICIAALRAGPGALARDIEKKRGEAKKIISRLREIGV